MYINSISLTFKVRMQIKMKMTKMQKTLFDTLPTRGRSMFPGAGSRGCDGGVARHRDDGVLSRLDDGIIGWDGGGAGHHVVD